MFSVDSNYMNMALATQQVLGKYPELLKDRKSLLNKIKQMDAYIEGIQKNQVAAEPDSKGATESKTNAATHAIDMAMDLAGRAHVYADDIGNDVLKAQFGMERSYFAKAQDVLKISRLESLAQQLKAIVSSDSGSYDVTPEEVKQLQEATIILKKQLTNPRGVTVNRKSHNDNVKSHLALLKKTMIAIDKLMTKLRGTELFNEYKIARKVIDLGARKSQGRKNKEDENKPTDTPDGNAQTEG